MNVFSFMVVVLVLFSSACIGSVDYEEQLEGSSSDETVENVREGSTPTETSLPQNDVESAFDGIAP